MYRKINELNSIEFMEAYMVLAKYTNVGWDCVNIYCEKEQAIAKIKEIVPSEFNKDEVILRKVSLNGEEDCNYERLTHMYNGEE